MADKRFKPKKRPSRARKHVLLLVLLGLLMAGAVFMFYPPQEKIQQGLDVQGGLSIIMDATKTDGSIVTLEEMESAREIIDRRVNLLGASEASVQTQGNSQLLVQIPGSIDQTQALSTIGQTGVLEFINLADVEEQDAVVALLNSYTLSHEDINRMLAFDEIEVEQIGEELVNGRAPAGLYAPQSQSVTIDEDSTDFDLAAAQGPTIYKLLALEPGSYEPIFTGADINTVRVGMDGELSLNYAVNLELNSTASRAFGEVTTALAPTKGKVAIILDGVIQSAPAVQVPITDGNVSITGNYSLRDANSLKTVLDSGSLPVALSVISSQMVGPTLGQEALARGIMVALIGLILVALYLVVFYRGIGFMTSASILVFAVLYMGVLALLSYFGLFALSLAGIAGIVLAIGMAADSSILVLERFKEEIRMGRSVRASSVTGVRHAIITSIDADLVALISALTIFIAPLGAVSGFGLALAIGVVCDIIGMLFFKAPLIRLLAPRIITRHPGFWGVKEDEEYAEQAGELVREEG
ncbi:MAG: protein translocase subunit SecD [Coriobacteriia bacterium]|nr:protein translocase subunit SecD [Coriobacteriia bacterium]